MNVTEFTPTASQAAILSADADIVIYAGPVGCGKSTAMILAAQVRSIETEFRSHLIRDGQCDEIRYDRITIRLGQTLATMEDHIASKVFSTLCIDQLEDVSQQGFFNFLSRCRSGGRFRPRVYASVSPIDLNAESAIGQSDHRWIGKLLKWWIDPKTGMAIPERNGQKRSFCHHSHEIIWHPEEEVIISDFAQTTSITLISHDSTNKHLQNLSDCP